MEAPILLPNPDIEVLSKNSIVRRYRSTLEDASGSVAFNAVMSFPQPYAAKPKMIEDLLAAEFSEEPQDLLEGYLRDRIPELPLLIWVTGSGESCESLDYTLCSFPYTIFKSNPNPFGTLGIFCTIQMTSYRTMIYETPQIVQSIIEDIVETYAMARDHISISGLCSGAACVWDLILKAPDFYSFAAPISGPAVNPGSEELLPRLAESNLPILNVQGRFDDCVDYEQETKPWWEKCRAAGVNLHSILYERYGHNIDHVIWRRTPLIAECFAADRRARRDIRAAEEQIEIPRGGLT